jgi:hypothetical protein
VSIHRIAAAATVAAPKAGAEDPVIGQERWEWIRQQRGAGVTVSQIARESGQDMLAAHQAWLAQRAP